MSGTIIAGQLFNGKTVVTYRTEPDYRELSLGFGIGLIPFHEIFGESRFITDIRYRIYQDWLLSSSFLPEQGWFCSKWISYIVGGKCVNIACGFNVVMMVDWSMVGNVV